MADFAERVDERNSFPRILDPHHIDPQAADIAGIDLVRVVAVVAVLVL